MNSFEALKYLPLLDVAVKHPQLVELFKRIAVDVQPFIPEINQATSEIEATLTQIKLQKLTMENAK